VKIATGQNGLKQQLHDFLTETVEPRCARIKFQI